MAATRGKVSRRRLCRAGVIATGGLLTGGVARGLPWAVRPARAESAKRTAVEPIAWLAEIQQPPQTVPPDAPRLSPLLVDDAGKPLATKQAWEGRRAGLLEEWRGLLGDLGVSRRQPPTVETVGEETRDGVVIRLIRYDSEPGWPTEAYVLEPAAAPPSGGRPGAVIFHSTVHQSIREPAGLEGPASLAFGAKLARLGFVCVCPRNFLWPDMTHIEAEPQTRRFLGLHPGVTGMAKMLHDAELAVDLLLAREHVDGGRICAIGHSLGAKEVLYLAAFDERVKVTVSSEGGVGTTFSNWQSPWYLGPARERLGPRHEHHELIALAAPRPFLLVGGESADGDRSWPFIEAALPVYRLYDESPALGLLNHRKGHDVPQPAWERIEQWLLHYT